MDIPSNKIEDSGMWLNNWINIYFYINFVIFFVNPMSFTTIASYANLFVCLRRLNRAQLDECSFQEFAPKRSFAVHLPVLRLHCFMRSQIYAINHRNKSKNKPTHNMYTVLSENRFWLATLSAHLAGSHCPRPTSPTDNNRKLRYS